MKHHLLPRVIDMAAQAGDTGFSSVFAKHDVILVTAYMLHDNKYGHLKILDILEKRSKTAEQMSLVWI
ncbi:hypothetical protein NC653_012447 [Populus alba x Populus x berolinensis]|uniref:Uncharacterized protein n=1 Tax=Populus alba x Populus x berolinensis TaxID=444605 RepID=A0AAD6QRX8_9ROSI|nr:hypothetical protein NC653_012447 [Populus alba x Populus x berolinensis]